MPDMSSESLEQALGALGELLAERRQSFDLVVIGGGSLLLSGLLARPTEDLDVVARIEDGAYVSAEPLPPPLIDAIAEIGRLLGLGSAWLNPGPAQLLEFGLPDGFSDRVQTRAYAGLTVHLADRVDQIAFKLYASVDQGPGSKHFADLRRLAPTEAELLAAAAWTRTHDTSDGFRDQLEQALFALGITDVDL